MVTETLVANKTKVLSGINVLLGTAVAISSIILVGSAIIGSMSLSNSQAVANLMIPFKKVSSTAVTTQPKLTSGARPTGDTGSRTTSTTDVCEITPESIITTVAGNGTGIYVGENVPALSSGLLPSGLAFDNYGNLYNYGSVSVGGDRYDRRLIRKIDMSTGLMTTIAGLNCLGYPTNIPMPAIDACLILAGVDFNGGDIAFDSTYHNLYVVNSLGLYKLDIIAGTIVRVNGVDGPSGGGYVGLGGPLSSFGLRIPFDFGGSISYSGVHIVVDPNDDNIIFFSDSSNGVIKVDMGADIVTRFAGNGISGYSGDGGPATLARLNRPTGLAFDSRHNLYISDGSGAGGFGNRIRMVDGSGNISTIAGNGGYGFSGDGGLALYSSLFTPVGLKIDANDNIFIADAGNSRIRKIDHLTGIINTIAGNGTDSGDGGPAISAMLSVPHDLAISSVGDIFFTDYGSKHIRKISCSNPCPVTAPTAPATPTLSYVQPTFTTNFSDPNCTDTGLIRYKIYQPNATIGYSLDQMRDCTLTGTDGFGRPYVRAEGTVNATSNNQTLTFDMPAELVGYPAYVCVQAEDNGGLTSGWARGSITRTGAFTLEP